MRVCWTGLVYSFDFSYVMTRNCGRQLFSWQCLNLIYPHLCSSTTKRKQRNTLRSESVICVIAFVRAVVQRRCWSCIKTISSLLKYNLLIICCSLWRHGSFLLLNSLTLSIYKSPLKYQWSVILTMAWLFYLLIIVMLRRCLRLFMLCCATALEWLKSRPKCQKELWSSWTCQRNSLASSWM